MRKKFRLRNASEIFGSSGVISLGNHEGEGREEGSVMRWLGRKEGREREGTSLKVCFLAVAVKT